MTIRLLRLHLGGVLLQLALAPLVQLLLPVLLGLAAHTTRILPHIQAALRVARPQGDGLFCRCARNLRLLALGRPPLVEELSPAAEGSLALSDCPLMLEHCRGIHPRELASSTLNEHCDAR